MFSMGKSWNRGGNRGFNRNRHDRNRNYENNQRGNRNNRGARRENRQNRNQRNDYNDHYDDVPPNYEELDPEEYDYNDEERHFDDYSNIEDRNEREIFHDEFENRLRGEVDERNVVLASPPYDYDRRLHVNDRPLSPGLDFRNKMEERQWREKDELGDRHRRGRCEMENRPWRDRNEIEDQHWREQSRIDDREWRDGHEIEDRLWRDRGQMEHRHLGERNDMQDQCWREHDEMGDRVWRDKQDQPFIRSENQEQRNRHEDRNHGRRYDDDEFQNRNQSRVRGGPQRNIDDHKNNYNSYEINRDWDGERERIDQEHFDDPPFEELHQEERYEREFPIEENRGSHKNRPCDKNRAFQQNNDRGSQQRNMRVREQRDSRVSQQRDIRGHEQRDSRVSQQRDIRGHEQRDSRVSQQEDDRQSISSSSSRNRSGGRKNQSESRSRSPRYRRDNRSHSPKSQNSNSSPFSRDGRNRRGHNPYNKRDDKSNYTQRRPNMSRQRSENLNEIPPPIAMDPAQSLIPGPILSNLVPGDKPGEVLVLIDPDTGIAMPLTTDNPAMINAVQPGPILNNPSLHIPPAFGVEPHETSEPRQQSGYERIRDKYRGGFNQKGNNVKNSSFFKNRVVSNLRTKATSYRNQSIKTGANLTTKGRNVKNDRRNMNNKANQIRKDKPAVKKPGSNRESLEESLTMLPINRDTEDLFHSLIQKRRQELKETKQNEMPENVPFFDDSRHGGIGRDQYASLEDDRFHHTDRTVEVESYGNEKFRDQNLLWDMERPENYRNQTQDFHHHRNGANYEKSRVNVRERLGSEPRYDLKGPLRNDGFSKPDHKHVNIHQGKFGEQMEVKERLGLKHGQHVVENVSDFGNVDHRKNYNFNDGIERTVSYQHDYLNSEFYDRDKRYSKDDSYVSDHTSYQKMNKKSRWSPATEIVNQERKVELYDLKPTQTSSRRDSSKISTPEHKTDTRGRYRHSSSLSPKRRKFDHNAHDLQNGKQGQGHEKARNNAGKNADHLKGQDRNVKVVPEKVVNQSQKRGNSLDRDYRTKEKMSPSGKQKQEHEKISDMDRVNRTLAHASQSSYVAKTDKISPGRTRHEIPIGSSSSGDRAISGSENKMDSQPTSPDVISFQKNQIKTLSSILEVLQNKINADENKKKEEEKRKADEMKLKNEALEAAKRINEKASKIIQEQVPGESARQRVVNDLDPTFKPLLDKMTPRMTKTGALIPSLLDGMDHLSKLTVEEKVKLAATLPRLAEVADPNKMSLADKIRLLRFIMDTKSQDENPIKVVEESIRGCGLGLTLKYEAHEIKCVAGRPAFTGTLHLSDAFLARSVGFTKKEIKHNIYEQALNLLKNKTAAEIVAMKDPGIDELRKELVLSIVEEKHKKSEHLESESQETKFKKLIQYIKDNKNSCLSPVTFLHKAIESSQCSLKSHYYTKRVNLPIGELFFFHKGVLLIDDIVIGIGTGHKGKTVKPAAYCNAIETLKRKSVKHILTGIRPLKDDVLPPIFVDREKFKISSKKRMEYLVKDLKESQMEDHQEAINKAAKESWLTPLCVYKIPKNERQKRWIHCEFFINQLLVGEGEGEQMKDAELEAYNSAWRLLRNVSVESMFENNRKMNLADFSDPTIVDVQLKVNFQSVSNTTDCNLAALKRLKFDLNQEGKTKEGLVILEHEEWSLDRKGQAFSILNHSATQNGMFLHWLIQPEGKLFKCAFNLQGECVGEATAADRNGAKNLAAADALFRLYDSHDVVKITRWDDSKLWTEYWEIKEQAMKLAKEESGGEGVHEKGAPKLKWIIDVCQQMIEDYMKKYSLEELIFGPGMPLTERSEVQKLAKKMDLKHEMRQQEGNAYLVLSKKMTPQEMATCLHQNGGISGKYSLVPVTQLPKSSSIEQEKRKYKRPGYDKLLEEVEDAKKPRWSSDENTRTQNNDSSINTTSTKRGKTRTRFSDSKPYSHDQTVTTNPILYSSASNTTTISTGHVTVSKAVIPPPGVAIPMLSTQPNYQALSTQPVVAVPHLVSQASSAVYNKPLSYKLPDSVVPQCGTPVSQVQRYTTPASTAVQVHASPNALATTQPAVRSSFVFGLNQAPGIQPLVHQSVQNTPIVQQQVANSIPLGNTPTLNNQGLYVKGVQPVVQQPVSQVVQPVIRQLVPQPVPQPVPPVQNPQASTVPVHSTGVKYQSMPPIASSLPLQQTRPQVPASISQYPPQVVQQPTVQTNLATESQKLLMIQQEALEKMRAQTTQQIGNNMVPQPTQHLNQPVLNRMPPPVTMPIQPTANQMPIVVPVSNQTANRPVAPNFSVPPPNFRFPPPAVTSVVHSSVSSSTVGQTQSQISAELKTHTNPFVNISNQKKSSSTAVTSSIQINLLYKSGKNSIAPSKNQTLSSKSKATEQQKRRQAVLTTIDTSKNVSVDKSSSRPSSSNVSQTYSSAVNETTSKVLSSTTTTVAQEEIPKSNVQQLVEKALKVFGGTAELESALNTIKGISQEQNKTSVSGSMGGGILDSILKQRVKETKPTPEKNTATLILSSQPGAKSTIIKPAETKQTQSRNNDNKTPGANTEENKRNEQPLKTNEKYKRSILGVSGMLSHMRKQQEKEHKSAYEKFKETVVKPSEKEDKASDDEPKDTQTRKPYDIQPSSGIGVKGILKQPGRVDNSVTDSQFKHYQRQTPNLRSYRQTNRDSPPENETSPRVEVFPRGKGVNELKVENNQAKPVLKSILKNKTASDIKEQKSEDYTDLNRKNDLYYSQFGFSKQDSSKSNLGRTQERIFGDSDKHDKDYQQSESEKNTPFWLHKSQGSNIESEYGRHTEPEIYHTKQSFESSTSFMKQKNEDNSRLSSYRNQFRDSTETYDREESSFKKASVIPGLDYVHSPSSDVDGEHLGGYESRPKPLMNVSNHSKPSGAHLGSSTMEKKPNEERFNAYDLDSLLGNKNKQNVHTGIPYTGNYTESSSEQFGQQTSLNSQKLSDTLKSIRDNYNQPNDGYYGNESNMNRPYHLSSDRQSSCYNPSFTVPSSRQDNSLGALPSLKQQFPFGFGVTNKSPSLQQNQSGFGSLGTSSSRFPGFQGNTMGIPSGIGREYGLPRFSSRQPTPSSSVSSTPSYMMDSLDNFTAESRAERKEKRF